MSHIDTSTLASELIRPEYGFKPVEGKSDTYFTSTCQLSVVGLMEALKAFSVTAGSNNSSEVVVYTDLEQWGEQLAALYPRDGIEFAAEALHRIFLSPEYRVEDSRFIGMAFRLWKEFNKLLNANTESVRFFKDGRFEQTLEDYVKTVSGSKIKRSVSVCLGLTKLLDESLEDVITIQALSGTSHQVFNSRFMSPPVDGFRVTPDGKLTVVYCLDSDDTIRKLSSYLGTERVHPIIILFPASADYAAFEEQLNKYPILKRCVLTSRLVVQEEDFLIKYSARDIVFEPQEARLSKVANGLLKSYQDEWISRARAWANKIRQEGYLIAPIWSKAKGIPVADFAKGYRYMLATNNSLDGAHENHGGPLSDVEFENCKQAAKKNTNPPTAWNYGDLLEILTTDHYPKVPRCFFSILRELKTQTAAKKLAKTFFFIVPETQFKSVQQMGQILELMIGLGVIRQTSGELFRAIDQNQLEIRREATSKWLKNECKGAIKNCQGLFPTQAGILLNASYPKASLMLEDAEKKIKTIDFKILNAPSVSSLEEDAFTDLVAQVLKIENLIIKVCPLEIGSKNIEFECVAAQIGHFEQKYNTLSLWQKVSFLSWLKKQFLSKREELLSEINGIIKDSNELKSASGKPFPIAPLTLPLKAIQNELENALKGVGSPSMTRMATIKAGNYTLLIDQYLVDSKYESAWERLSALADLVTPDMPDSFYSRFVDLKKRWESVIQTFEGTDSVWKQLSEFTKDAPPEMLSDLSGMKLEIQKYNGMIAGGLESQIQSQCDDVSEDALLTMLENEVDACELKLQPMQQKISDRLDTIKSDLLKIIRRTQLQALNKLLQSKGKRIMDEAKSEETYQKTKMAYESFNTKVISEGDHIFEQSGNPVSFELWVDIYKGLSTGAYSEEKHPDHNEALKALKKMKLIRTRLELR